MNITIMYSFRPGIADVIDLSMLYMPTTPSAPPAVQAAPPTPPPQLQQLSVEAHQADTVVKSLNAREDNQCCRGGGRDEKEL